MSLTLESGGRAETLFEKRVILSPPTPLSFFPKNFNHLNLYKAKSTEFDALCFFIIKLRSESLSLPFASERKWGAGCLPEHGEVATKEPEGVSPAGGGGVAGGG